MITHYSYPHINNPYVSDFAWGSSMDNINTSSTYDFSPNKSLYSDALTEFVKKIVNTPVSYVHDTLPVVVPKVPQLKKRNPIIDIDTIEANPDLDITQEIDNITQIYLK